MIEELLSLGLSQSNFTEQVPSYVILIAFILSGDPFLRETISASEKEP